MKKKGIGIISVILIAVLICAFFVACDGKDGSDGKSAYELAVEQGFEGTLEEWLDSLKGSDGINGTNGKNGADGADGSDGAVDINQLYDKAVEEGFDGSYLDFLNQYLSLNSDYSVAASKALLSAVKVKSVNYYYNLRGSEVKYTTSGSGVIYKLNKQTGSAYIITNYHVVYHGKSFKIGGISDEISVFLYGKEKDEDAISAKYIGGAYDCDIAILYVEESQIIKDSEAEAVEVASSKDVVAGSTAIAVGNPSSGGTLDTFQDIKISVTQGVVSVDSESLSIMDTSINYSITTRVMRVDAAINSGNSGGGLYNKDGKLIGIVNAKASSSSIENMGYAIPSDVVKGIADYAIAHCNGVDSRYIKKLDLGITTDTLSSKAVYDSAAKVTRLVEEIAVKAVADDSVAKDILQSGDIIKAVEIDGTMYDISRAFALSDALWNAKEGETATIKMYITREGVEMSVTLSVSANNFKKME